MVRSRIARSLLLMVMVLGVVGWPLTQGVQGAISPARSISALGVAVTENFDTLADSGTSSTAPTGWDFTESSGDPDAYTASNGASTAEDTYSYGTTASTERAFGSQSSAGGNGGLTSTIYAQFSNDTGATINELTIAYNGEKWRVGDIGGGADGFTFAYSTDATDLTDGTYTAFTGLNYTAANSGTVGDLDGNANQTAVSSTITGLSLADGASIFLRFSDVNGHGNGAEDGVAIDDFSITAESDDDDGDGEPDGTDTCPATDPNDTPIIGGCGYSERPGADDDGDGENNGTDTTCKTTDPNDTPIIGGCGYSERPGDDDDGDGENNGTDTTCESTDPNDTPIVGGCGQSERPDDDDDSDTVNNGVDNCVDDANADQADSDGDGQGDVCDDDVDGDGVDDVDDACPLVFGAGPDGCPLPGPLPALTISDGSPAKTTPNKDCTITVTRSGDLSGTTTVDYTTVDGSAKAGKHYVAESDTLTFAPDETEKTIVIDVLKRSKRNKKFTVELSNATGGTIDEDDSGKCVIKRKR